MLSCCTKSEALPYNSAHHMNKGKVLQITALVTFLLALFSLAMAYIFKGVSLLPYRFTRGLEHVYGISSILFKRTALFFGLASLCAASTSLCWYYNNTKPQ